MSLTAVIDALEAVALAEFPLEDDAGVSVYRWWEPGMHLPALWHWLTEDSSSSPTPDGCRVEDTYRITVSIAVAPARNAGEDAEALEVLADRLAPVLDNALAGRHFAGSKRARRTGMRMELERLGDTQALAIAFPLELVLESPLDPST